MDKLEAQAELGDLEEEMRGIDNELDAHPEKEDELMEKFNTLEARRAEIKRLLATMN